MRRALFCLFALFCAFPVSAQDFLTQAEIEDILRENAFCYVLQADGTCTWAEYYPVLEETRLELHVATVIGPGETVVLRQEAAWIQDAMCIRDGDLGVLDGQMTANPWLSFDLSGLTPMEAATVEGIVAQIAATLNPKTCFRFARDPARPGGLVQITFSDSVQLEGSDAITLAPLSIGGVQLLNVF